MVIAQDSHELFGRLIPFRYGKLIRRWAIPLRKDNVYYSLGASKDCDIRVRRFRSVGESADHDPGARLYVDA